jgi:hypothetical protein
MSIERLETDRLIGLRLEESHRPHVRAMFQDPKVAATLGGPLSDSDVDRTLERSLHHWDRHGFGNWTGPPRVR